MRKTQSLGMLLWRGGLLIVASYTFFRGARFFLTYVDLPIELEVGFGLGITGAAFVLGSLIMERVQDAREEQLTE